MSSFMLGTAVYWDPAIGSTIWIRGCICTEQNQTEIYRTERHLKDNMQISNRPTFEEIKLLDHKLKLLWTLKDKWNYLNWETFEMKLNTVSSMHSACLPGLIHPRLRLLHSQAPATAVLHPKDCPIFHCLDTLPHSQGTPKSEVWQRVMCIHNPRDVTNWMMNHELSWGYNVAFFYTFMSVKSQRQIEWWIESWTELRI